MIDRLQTPARLKGWWSMDVNALTTLIGSLGFPVVMCIIIFLQMQKNEEAHKEEIKQLTEAVQNNTIAIVEMTAYFKKDVEQ